VLDNKNLPVAIIARYADYVKLLFPAPGNGSGLTSCNVTKLIKKGCYLDHYWQRTLPTRLETYPKGVDWHDGWDDFLHDVTCQ
jgi:hypothetical protein